MKKSVLMSSMFVAAALVSQSALAEVKLRAGAGTSTYELGGDYTHAKSTYSPTAVGATFSWDTGTTGAYVDVAYSSGTGTHDGWATANSPTTICGGTSCGNVASPNEGFKRSDWALTGGAVFLNPNSGIAGNIYVGLKGAPLRWMPSMQDCFGLRRPLIQPGSSWAAVPVSPWRAAGPVPLA